MAGAYGVRLNKVLVTDDQSATKRRPAGARYGDPVLTPVSSTFA
jgi:hypothetical protein